MKKKAREVRNEIAKLETWLAVRTNSETSRASIRRKLRALVRKAYFVGQYIPRYYKSRTDKFVDLFGFKP